MPPPGSHDVVADETVWTERPDKDIYNYPRSKVLAERDAWTYVRANEGLELVTVLPNQIQGPALGSDLSPSVSIIAMMLKGKLPAVPNIGWGIVDVRDVVDLHIRAMTSPDAPGQRFIADTDFLWLKDAARILRKDVPGQAKKIPKLTLPNAVVRLGSLFNNELKQLAGNLDQKQLFSAEKARRVLGWAPRPARDAVVATARSLIDQGVV